MSAEKPPQETKLPRRVFFEKMASASQVVIIGYTLANFFSYLSKSYLLNQYDEATNKDTRPQSPPPPLITPEQAEDYKQDAPKDLEHTIFAAKTALALEAVKRSIIRSTKFPWTIDEQ